MQLYNNLDKSWFAKLENEFSKPYYLELEDFISERKESGVTIYPEEQNIFRALNLTPFENTKVVILGQDPYHGKGQAHGLSFSVQDGVKFPPSLRNIYKELADDLNIPTPETGFLEPWAKQGVLLINAVFTVEESNPNSHAKKGWENLTDEIIKHISEEKENVVFVLWGAYAQKKSDLINSDKHLIIKTPHPSPFSARKGFFGSKPFSKTNEYLISKGITPINWII